ncbi:MAG TPA: efflux RND transporter periplasmic adaptor subunit [Pseudidiomarina sp.]|nr:efflux RND transporter periplasmic adaptor subunit [Pseudidiomarina sp.]
MNTFSSKWMVYFLAVMLTLSQGLFALPSVAQEHQHQDESKAQALAQPETLESQTIMVEYICPMHSHIVRAEPGTCPICGMELEPREQRSQIDVTVSDQMQQNLGIQTTAAYRTTLWRYFPTIGTVEWNDNARVHIHPRADGWLEALAIRSEGQRVEVGDLLYSIYSRELVVAQQDLLQAAEGANLADSQRQRLIRDARLRLELLGMTATQTDAIIKNREILYQVPVYAPAAGVVTELNVAQGMYVQPSTELLTITGDQSVWLIADVPERYSDWLRVGAPADITLPQAGLRGYETEIDYIYPELDPTTRTQRVRILLPESSQTPLHVGMQVQVELFGGPRRDVLAVPVSSLILTGSENRVIVRNDDGAFVQRPVEVGLVIGGEAEILHGLTEGEQVVTAGQFLLDSEASLLMSRQQQSNAPAEAQDAHANH